MNNWHMWEPGLNLERSSLAGIAPSTDAHVPQNNGLERALILSIEVPIRYNKTAFGRDAVHNVAHQSHPDTYVGECQVLVLFSTAETHRF
jgi:hypothetical protein